MKLPSAFQPAKPLALAALLALCTTAALAEGFAVNSSDNKPGCAEVGCNGGARLCGTIERSSWELYWFLDIPIVVPEHEVYSCYESLSYS